jgi:hypothetical protein
MLYGILSKLHKEKQMQITDKAKEKLGTLGEFAAWYAPLIGLFLFFYSQTSAMNHRIDETIRSGNERADRLHQEFIDLLKEMRK